MSGFRIFLCVGIRKTQMQHAGGMLLPPVQKLVATFIFATGESANESRHSDLAAFVPVIIALKS